MSAIHNLKEGDLRISGQVKILCAIGYKLHKASTHFVLNYAKKIFLSKINRTILFASRRCVCRQLVRSIIAVPHEMRLIISH
jgi:hypothetical protein